MAYTIEALQRASKTAATVRESGRVPGIIYGPDIQPISLSVPTHAFDVLLEEAGGASLIDVAVEGGQAPITALIQDVQYDPVSGRPTHVDFRQINLKKEMTAPIEFRFVGESAAVKGLGGTLIKALSGIEIKCLPKDLVNHIDVNLSVLNTFDDAIRVSDLAMPQGITVVGDTDTVVAKVAAPLTEEQLKAMEEGVGPKSLEDIEVEEKGKKEEEAEPAEGEEAPKDAKAEK
jgi:large subunit ribosomal protein L25